MGDDDGIFFATDKFQLSKRIGDPVIWTDPTIEFLATSLLTSSGPERDYFFKKFTGQLKKPAAQTQYVNRVTEHDTVSL